MLELRRSWWADLGLRAKGLVVVAAPAAATVLIAGLFYWIGHKTASAEQAVRQTLTARLDIYQVTSTEADAGSHLRAYLISGDASFLNQAEAMLVQCADVQQRLAPLISGSPAQQERYSRMLELHNRRIGNIHSLLAQLRSGVTSAELGAAMESKDNRLLQIEDVLDQMQTEEGRVLTARRSHAERLIFYGKLVTAICAIVGVIGGILISILFASGITRRIEKLRQNVERLATGGELSPMPTGRDEIGDLGDGVTNLAKVLRLRTAALDYALHGIAEANANHRYLSFNKAYQELAALTDLETAPSVIETVHPEDRAAVEQALLQMRERSNAELEVRIERPNGAVATVAMTLLGMSEEERYFVFLLDITRRKEVESALRKAKEEAVASNSAKTTFLAKISHDIRTPLNAVLGAADLLSRTILDGDQRDYVNMFRRNARRLVSLINDFLDFSKIEAGAVQMERIPLDVREMVEEAASTFRESAHRKRIGLSVDIAPEVPAHVYGDPLRLQQVLVNLISNALKFTQRGAVRVVVSVAPGERREQLNFEVIDTGPGIPPEDHERIFGAFSQAQRMTAAGGCGLGLTICRELVDRMGGEIGVTSELGAGSTFRFTLPLEEARPYGRNVTGDSPAASGSRCGEHPIRILVAEDTEDNRLLLQHYLRNEAMILRFAENGEEAVEALASGERFDLILMDLDMPVLDGFQAARAIREFETARGGAPTPIVGLSAHAMRDAVRECLEAGCAAHLAKPIDSVKLLNAIARYARPAEPKPMDAEPIEGVAALVPGYLASKPKQIDAARASLSKKDFEPVRRFGHNLKGTGPGYGFPQIREFGSLIERAALERDEQGIAQQLEALLGFVMAEQKAANSLQPDEAGITCAKTRREPAGAPHL